MSESCHFIQNASKGPYIRLSIVRLVFTQLWRQVIGCSNHCLSHAGTTSQQLSHSQVPDLDPVLSVQEDIEGFEVTMKNLLPVELNPKHKKPENNQAKYNPKTNQRDSKEQPVANHRRDLCERGEEEEELCWEMRGFALRPKEVHSVVIERTL